MILPPLFGEFSIKPGIWVFWLLFAFVVIVYALITAVLVFHWRKYGLKSYTIKLAETIYFMGSALFFLIALISISRI